MIITSLKLYCDNNNSPGHNYVSLNTILLYCVPNHNVIIKNCVMMLVVTNYKLLSAINYNAQTEL